MKKVNIYTDGACKGNPNGPGGYGTILEYVDNQGKVHSKELSQGFLNTTNNRMEMMAAIVGLECLKSPCYVSIYSDSKYLVDAIRQGWLNKWKQNDWYRDKKRKNKAKNTDLWIRLSRLLKIHNVEFNWVKGHAGNPYNERCDYLATSAAEKDNLYVDKQDTDILKGC